MKSFNNVRSNKNSYQLHGFEELTVAEMFKIRGGTEDEKIKTKEIDIYDTRES